MAYKLVEDYFKYPCTSTTVLLLGVFFIGLGKAIYCCQVAFYRLKGCLFGKRNWQLRVLFVRVYKLIVAIIEVELQTVIVFQRTLSGLCCYCFNGVSCF